MKTLIKNVMILTMEAKDKIIKEGYIIIHDNKIEKVAEGSFNGDEKFNNVIDGKDHCAMPGLINAHTHAAMTLLRGYGEGLPLMKWLQDKIWPMEAKFKKEHINIGTKLAIVEMLRTGTTTFNDMYFNEDEVFRVCEDNNMRAVLGIPLIGDAWESQLTEAMKLKDYIRENSKGLVTSAIAPHSPYTLSKEALKSAASCAYKNNMPVHIHIAETLDEVDIIKNKYNLTPCEFLESTGLFKNKVTAAHVVHLTGSDMEILKEYSVSAVYNPESNMKLASGISKVHKMNKLGINVALGTDGASSNNNLNMMEEMQSAALLQKLYENDPTVLDSYDVIKMATVSGAKALGFKNLGMISEGYLADIILLDLNKPSMVPLYDIYSNIVFSASGSEVDTVLVNGNILMEKGKFVSIDEERIISDCKKLCEKLV